MYRKILANITATAIVITMVASSGITSFASTLEGDQTEKIVNYDIDDPVTVNGDVTVEEGNAVTAIGSEVTVNGDVNAATGDAIYADDIGDIKVEGSVEGAVKSMTGSSVTIKGDVVSNGDEKLHDIFSYDSELVTSCGENAEVYVGGDIDGGDSKIISQEIDDSWVQDDGSIVELDTSSTIGGVYAGVYVNDGAYAVVQGDVTGGGYGADVSGDSSLFVGGDVTANGIEIINSGRKYSSSEDTVGEEYSEEYFTGNGIATDGDGGIVVRGDVEGLNNGINISIRDANESAGSIVVLGTVKGGDCGIKIEDAYFMSYYIEDNDEKSYEERCKEAADLFMLDVPDITVYAIEGEETITDGIEQGVHVEGYDAYKLVYENIVNAINYIIKQEDPTNESYGITVDATSQIVTCDESVMTTKINQAFSVAANLPDGYTISGGDNVNVVDNGNGTYSLTLTSSNGGINIKAILKPSSDSSDSYDVVVQDVEPSTAPPVINAVYTPNTPQKQALVSSISGAKESKTVSFNSSDFTPEQFKEIVISSIAASPENGALNIISDKGVIFDSSMIEALTKRSDIDVNVVFTHGGKQYKVVIPAGYDVKSLLDSKGYCGHLRLLDILGGQEL